MSMQSAWRGALGGLALLAVAVEAQTPVRREPRADRFLGCWTPASLSGAPARPLTCIAPSDSVPSALELQAVTVSGRALGAPSVVRLSGVERRSALGECSMTEQAIWSSDSARLFLRGTQRCGTDAETPQRGLMTLDGNNLLMIRGSSAGTQVDVLVQDLPTFDSATVMLPRVMARALELGDAARSRGTPPVTAAAIAEAVENTSAPVVEGWFAAQGRPVMLSASTLRSLKAAGVPGRVIDVLVARANPDEFSLQPARRPGMSLMPATLRAPAAPVDAGICAQILGALKDPVNGLERLRQLPMTRMQMEGCARDESWGPVLQTALLDLTAGGLARVGWVQAVQQYRMLGGSRPMSLAYLAALLDPSWPRVMSSLQLAQTSMFRFGGWNDPLWLWGAYSDLLPFYLSDQWGWSNLGGAMWDPRFGYGFLPGNGPIIGAPNTFTGGGGGGGSGGGSGGRVVAGRGYERGESGGSSTSGSIGSSGSSGVSSGSAGSAGSTSGTSGGYSPGAGSSSTGRTAKERP